MVKRIKEITYLRAFAALSIVLIHATSGYVNLGTLGAALNQFPRYGSPVFVIMSGFILYHIEIVRPSPSYMHFFRYRFLKVAIPYVIWTVIYSFFSMRGQLLAPGSLDAAQLAGKLLLSIVTGTGYVHLYFILIMIQLYALFPFLKKAIEKYAYTTLITAALISFSLQSLIYLHRLQVLSLPSLGIPYAALFPGWLVFFCFGIFLKTRLDQIMNFWRERQLMTAVLWLIFLAATVLEGSFSPVNISLRPTVSLYGAATFFLFYLVFEHLKKYLSEKNDRLLEWIANNSFQIYLIHPLVLNLLVLYLKWGGYGGLVLLYITAVIATCLTIHILNKTKETIKKTAGQLLRTEAKEA